MLTFSPGVLCWPGCLWLGIALVPHSMLSSKIDDAQISVLEISCCRVMDLELFVIHSVIYL